jgi:hypothetical protein
MTAVKGALRGDAFGMKNLAGERLLRSLCRQRRWAYQCVLR